VCVCVCVCVCVGGCVWVGVWGGGGLFALLGPLALFSLHSFGCEQLLD
jgi:hypothetical protein